MGDHLGYLEDGFAQHFDSASSALWQQDRRLVQRMVRTYGRDASTGEWIVADGVTLTSEPSSIGYRNDAAVWYPSGLPDPEGKTRPFGLWANGYPGVVSQSGGGSVTDPYKSDVTSSTFVTPAFGQDPQDPTTWIADSGLIQQRVAVAGGSELAVGTPVVVLPFSVTSRQRMAAIPAGPASLIAVWRGTALQGTKGTIEYDVKPTGELDYTTRARIHTRDRLVRLPETGLLPFGARSGADQKPFPPSSLIAWQLGLDIEGQAGYGAVVDQVAAPTSNPTTTGGGGGGGSPGGSTVSPAAATGSTRSGAAAGGAPGTVSQSSVIALTGRTAFGCHSVGQFVDKHHIAVTPRGEPVNCLPGSEVVETPSGPRLVQEIKAGDVLLGATGWTTVLETFKRTYRGLIYRISVGTRVVEVTEEHPVATPQGWVEANQLRDGVAVFEDASEIDPPHGVDIFEVTETVRRFPLLRAGGAMREAPLAEARHDLPLPPLTNKEWSATLEDQQDAAKANYRDAGNGLPTRVREVARLVAREGNAQGLENTDDPPSDVRVAVHDDQLNLDLVLADVEAETPLPVNYACQPRKVRVSHVSSVTASFQEVTVYNFRTGDSTFFAGGVLTHNCSHFWIPNPVDGDGFDAPFKPATAWRPVSRGGPLVLEVFHRYDDADRHDFLGGTRQGLRKWQVELPVDITPDDKGKRGGFDKASGKDAGKDAGKDQSKDAVFNKDAGKDSGKDQGKDNVEGFGKDASKDGSKDQGKDNVEGFGKDASKDSSKDSGKDQGKDSGKDQGKDTAKDAGKDPAKDQPKDTVYKVIPDYNFTPPPVSKVIPDYNYGPQTPGSTFKAIIDPSTPPAPPFVPKLGPPSSVPPPAGGVYKTRTFGGGFLYGPDAPQTQGVTDGASPDAILSDRGFARTPLDFGAPTFIGRPGPVRGLDTRGRTGSLTPGQRAIYDSPTPISGQIAAVGAQSTGSHEWFPGFGPGVGLFYGGSSRQGGFAVLPSNVDLRAFQDGGKVPQTLPNTFLYLATLASQLAWSDFDLDANPIDGYVAGRGSTKTWSLDFVDHKGVVGGASDLPSAAFFDATSGTNPVAQIWGGQVVTTSSPSAGVGAAGTVFVNDGTNGSPGGTWKDPSTFVTSSSGIFGDGHDGAAVFNGGAVPGASGPVGLVYTLTRDVYYSSLSFGATYQLFTAGYRVFVNGVCTIGATNSINCDGNPASGATAGAAIADHTVRGGAAGGASAGIVAGGHANGNPGGNEANSFGNNGGAGGNASVASVVGTGGAGGTATAPNADYGELYQIPQIVKARLESALGDAALGGGAGGGAGGGSCDGTSTGVTAPGGGGAGVCLVVAKQLVNNGVIAARGGPGGSAASASGPNYAFGGGGGGGGGLVVVVYGAAGSTLGSLLVIGGNGGAAVVTGTGGAFNGANGLTGLTRVLAL